MAWRVLIIDDNEIALATMESVLQTPDFEPRTALNLDEFSKIIDEWPPQIILSDVNMPGMSGPELCTELKKQLDTAHVPIVLCSGLSPAVLEVLAEDCEADAFLSKEDGFDKIPELLKMVCESVIW